MTVEEFSDLLLDSLTQRVCDDIDTTAIEMGNDVSDPFSEELWRLGLWRLGIG